MRHAVAVVRDWQVHSVSGETGAMNAASLVKQVVGHVALALIEDLDQPVQDDITVRHVLSHTTGLPNWRPAGEQLRPLRPPGTRWGYSGEGFVLLQRYLEQVGGAPVDELVNELVLEPLAMTTSHIGSAEPGFHGYRPLLTTAQDYATFLAHALSIQDQRWMPQWQIDDEIAWGAGWGLELGEVTAGWQWGSNDDASNFVIGYPDTGDGVVVLTNDPEGRSFYRSVVERELPGDHPSLRVENNPNWLEHFR